MASCSDMETDATSLCPVWVKTFGLPLEMWTEEGLSRVCSHLGKPQAIDSLTASRQRIDCARVCIEVSAEATLVHDFYVKGIDGTFHVKAFCQGLPILCEACKKFGHSCADNQSSAPCNEVSPPSAPSTNPPQFFPVPKRRQSPKNLGSRHIPSVKNSETLHSDSAEASQQPPDQPISSAPLTTLPPESNLEANSP